MLQSLKEVLSLNFACLDTFEEGNIVDIVDDLTIAVSTTEASMDVVGTIARIRGAMLNSGGQPAGNPAECTVNTRFKARRDDRIAASGAVTVGPFVFDANGKVIQYTSAQPATVIGTNTGTQTYYAASATQNNLLELKYNGGASQIFTIPAGALTMAQVAADINASTTPVPIGFVASVDGSGHFVLTGNDINETIEIVTCTGNAYTALGLTVAVTTPGAGAAAVVTGSTTGTTTYVAATVAQNNQVAVSVAAGAAQTFTITAGAQTMAQVRDIINTATPAPNGFVVSVNSAGKIVFKALNDEDSLAISSVSHDAYTALGLTGGGAATTATASSHDPAAVRGLVINGPVAAIPATVTARAVEPITFVDSGTGQNNLVKVAIAGAGAVTFTITAGVQTQAQIATIITNATPVGFTATTDDKGRLVFTATGTDTIEIVDISGNAYSVLGLEEGITESTPANLVVQTLEY